jgi:tetratricopeptide (TPR) repeat protein
MRIKMKPGVFPPSTIHFRGAVFLVAWGFAALLLSGCKDEENPNPLVPDPTLETAEEYTDRGWLRFAAANFSRALDDFNAAIFLDATYGPANIGQGWTRLSQANSLNSMRGAVGPFGDAIDNGEEGADLLAGRAAAYLGSGNPFLGLAVEDAQAALAADGEFVFAHRPSFDAQDVRLIAAFAKACQGDYSGALEAADMVLESGIMASDQGTWVVDGTTYDSFNGAVLAHLFKVSEQFSG